MELRLKRWLFPSRSQRCVSFLRVRGLMSVCSARLSPGGGATFEREEIMADALDAVMYLKDKTDWGEK